jgi:hypothetical protein
MDKPAAAVIAPGPDDPRLTAVSRRQVIVTMMTINDYPEYLARACLLNSTTAHATH